VIFAIFGSHSLGVPEICMVSPFVITSEIPLAISWKPKDEMMGATCIFATTKPFIKPKSVPMASGRSSIIKGFSVKLKYADITVTMEQTAPTDRSIPPVSITMVIATAIRPIMEFCLKRL